MPSIIMEKRDNSYILIPSVIVDRYLNVASHKDLKVILWLLKNAGVTADDLEIARYLDITAEELKSAITFWVKNGVLAKRGERLSMNVMIPNGDSAPAYSGEVIEEKLKREPELHKLIKQAEKILEKLLSPNDISTLLSLHDWLGLKVEVILMIMDYCVSNGQKGMRSIEKTAIAFSDLGIDSYEKAENYIKEQQFKKTAESKIASLIGANGRALTDSEKKNINAWVSDFGFGLDMIKKAYESTVERTGKYSVSYMNTILRSWNEKGFKTLADAEGEAKPDSKKGKKETSYDLEKSLAYSWEIVHNDK